MMESTEKTSALLLAGGLGTRMQASLPKQFLELKGKPIALHCFDLFLSMQQIDEIVIVCAEGWQHLFLAFLKESSLPKKKVRFALPGKRRQDSVYNGLLATAEDSEFICIHDAARPLIDQPLVCRILEAAHHYGAAVAGIPLKFTIKESCHDNTVKCTPDRSRMWEIQTPQIIKRSILHEGFQYAESRGITVTDDASLAELIGTPVKLVEGSEKNIKITVPSDLLLANQLYAGTHHVAL